MPVSNEQQVHFKTQNIKLCWPNPLLHQFCVFAFDQYIIKTVVVVSLSFFVHAQVSADRSVPPPQRQRHHAHDRSSILHTTGRVTDEE